MPSGNRSAFCTSVWDISRPSPVRTTYSSGESGRKDCETSFARCAADSFATTRAPRCAPKAANSAALPPGPAHRSSHAESCPSRGAAASARVTSCEPTSCARTVPSRTLSNLPKSPAEYKAESSTSSPSTAPFSKASCRSPIPGSAIRFTTGAWLSTSRSSWISAGDLP